MSQRFRPINGHDNVLRPISTEPDDASEVNHNRWWLMAILFLTLLGGIVYHQIQKNNQAIDRAKIMNGEKVGK